MKASRFTEAQKAFVLKQGRHHAHRDGRRDEDVDAARKDKDVTGDPPHQAGDAGDDQRLGRCRQDPGGDLPAGVMAQHLERAVHDPAEQHRSRDQDGQADPFPSHQATKRLFPHAWWQRVRRRNGASGAVPRPARGAGNQGWRVGTTMHGRAFPCVLGP